MAGWIPGMVDPGMVDPGMVEVDPAWLRWILAWPGVALFGQVCTVWQMLHVKACGY